MAKLKYALIIAQDPRFTRLANLSLGYRKLALTKLMPRLLEQVDDNHLELLAESRSMIGADGYWLAKDNKTRRQLIKDAVFLHRRKGTPWAVREICRRLGFGEIKLIEGLAAKSTTAVLIIKAFICTATTGCGRITQLFSTDRLPIPKPVCCGKPYRPSHLPAVYWCVWIIKIHRCITTAKSISTAITILE